MNRWLNGAAMLLALATAASAQEVKDGTTYEHKGLGISFSIPKDWGTIQITTSPAFSFEKKDQTVNGWLAVEEIADGTKLSDYADAFEAQLKGDKDLGGLKALPRKTAGSLIRCDYTLKYQDTPVVWIAVLGVKGTSGFGLIIMAHEDVWNDADGKKELDSLAGAFKCGAAKSEGSSNQTKVASPWAGWDVNSYTVTKVETFEPMASEIKTKQTLTSVGEKELVFKLESSMVKPNAMDMPASEFKQPLTGAGSGGTGGGAKVEDLGEETVKVGDKEVKCKKSKVQVDASTATEVWTSDAVPGATVKSVTKKDGKTLAVVTLMEFGGTKK